MTEGHITQALLASGPAGVALAFLGVIIRGWIQRLESTVDKMAGKFDALKDSVQRREVEIAKELTELQGAIKRHSRDINHLSAYLNQIASGGNFSGKPLAPIPAREKDGQA